MKTITAMIAALLIATSARANEGVSIKFLQVLSPNTVLVVIGNRTMQMRLCGIHAANPALIRQLMGGRLTAYPSGDGWSIYSSSGLDQSVNLLLLNSGARGNRNARCDWEA